MNKRMLKKSQGQLCKIRPRVIGFATPPDYVPRARRGRLDDTWRIRGGSSDGITLSNIGTGHFFELPFDSIVEYRQNLPGEPAYLILKSQVLMTRNHVFIEPIFN